MRYLADILTLFRLVVGFALIWLALVGQWKVGVALFIAAILSDAVDGICAEHWPYPSVSRWMLWRRSPDAWDMAADTVLNFGVATGMLATQFSWTVTLIVLAVNAAGAVWFVVMIERQKKRNLSRARALDIAFRWLSVAEILGLLTWMTYLATDQWWAFASIYAIGTVAMFVIKKDHALFRDSPLYQQIQ